MELQLAVMRQSSYYLQLTLFYIQMKFDTLFGEYKYGMFSQLCGKWVHQDKLILVICHFIRFLIGLKSWGYLSMNGIASRAVVIRWFSLNQAPLGLFKFISDYLPSCLKLGIMPNDSTIQLVWHDFVGDTKLSNSIHYLPFLFFTIKPNWIIQLKLCCYRF
jgi:hypothetical protein